jgi:hypothetical protein
MRSNFLSNQAGAVDSFVARAEFGVRIAAAAPSSQQQRNLRTSKNALASESSRQQLNGVRPVVPKVGDSGVIRVANCVNPVLALTTSSPTSFLPTTQGGKKLEGIDLFLGANAAAETTATLPESSGEDAATTAPTSRQRNRGLVISGANAAGKTVSLKTFGVAAFLAKMGIPLPASESCNSQVPSADNSCSDNEEDSDLDSVANGNDSDVGKDVEGRARVDFFDTVLTDIGDGQNVDAGLSTFGADVSFWRDTIDELTNHQVVSESQTPQEPLERTTVEGETRENSASFLDLSTRPKRQGQRRRSVLVLMDEVGGATETEAGGALGAAAIEAMVESSSGVGGAGCWSDAEAQTKEAVVGRQGMVLGRTRCRLVATTHHDTVKRQVRSNKTPHNTSCLLKLCMSSPNGVAHVTEKKTYFRLCFIQTLTLLRWKQRRFL